MTEQQFKVAGSTPAGEATPRTKDLRDRLKPLRGEYYLNLTDAVQDLEAIAGVLSDADLHPGQIQGLCGQLRAVAFRLAQQAEEQKTLATRCIVAAGRSQS